MARCVSLSQAVIVNATMPPTATVNGTVLTSTGVPVPNTDAGLSAPTLPYIAEPQNTQFSFTDAQGNFTMHVPPGPFIVFADSGSFCRLHCRWFQCRNCFTSGNDGDHQCYPSRNRRCSRNFGCR